MVEKHEPARPQSIAVDELAPRLERGDVFVLDVRRTRHDAQIYGSIHYDPKKLLAAARLILPLPKAAGAIVLYDEDGGSERLDEVAAALEASGYAEPLVLAGGFAAWRDAGLRTEEPSLEQPVPLVSEQQVER